MRVKYKRDVKSFLDNELLLAKKEDIDCILLSPEELQWLKEQASPEDLTIVERGLEWGFDSIHYFPDIIHYKGIRIEVERC